jgi:hypothetical protein
MWIAAQLFQRMNLPMISAEVVQEGFYSGVITTKGIRAQRCSERVHGSQEGILHGVAKWTAALHG